MNTLHIAVASFDPNCVQYYCDQTDNVDERNVDCHTSLQSIFMSDNLDKANNNPDETNQIIKILLEAKANPNLLTETFGTVLPEYISLCKEDECFTLLEYAIFCFNDKYTTLLLLKYGAYITEFIQENMNKMSDEVREALDEHNAMYHHGFKR
jgi:hypothetical protein